MGFPEGKVPAEATKVEDVTVEDQPKQGCSRPLTWAELASKAPSQPVSSTAIMTENALASGPTQTPSFPVPSATATLPAVPAFARATKEKPVVVLDAGALMRVEALDKYRQSCTFVTTAQAAAEVRDAMARQRIGLRLLDIHTMDASAADEAWAKKFADMTGDLPFLSPTDLGLIALTYMLQRATGQTERLRHRPPAFEYFSEAELRKSLESSGDSKHVWTLQHGNIASASSVERKGPASATGEGEGTVRCQVEDAFDEEESEQPEEDTDEEEGWVTEDVLRSHLGLAALGECSEERSGVEGSCDPGNTEDLADAFKGLELRANLQIVEDLVTCMTTDFSIQNVLLQMGLSVLAVDGRKIQSVKVWALLCRACGHMERKTKFLFCSKCGHYTLDRIPLYFDQKSGKILAFDGRKRFSKRGQVYSIPRQTGGKHSRPIILAADQLLMGGLDRELRHREKVWRKDVESKNPFSPNYCLEAQSWHLRAFTASGRAAAPAPPKVVVGLGPGNPNSNRWMKHRNRQRR